jgi:hypothetical protein
MEREYLRFHSSWTFELTNISQLFLYETRLKLEIRDDIVDEHSLILFINWCGERPQLNRKFQYIPGTRIGAVSVYC